MIEIRIKKSQVYNNEYKLYIMKNDSYRLSIHRIAELLNVTEEEYIKIVSQKFNAIIQGGAMNDILFFLHEEDAYKTKEWLESNILIRKLLGQNFVLCKN